MASCPGTGTRKRFYRPDWINAPDCTGCESCDGSTHQCHLFGLRGFCEWPEDIVMGNAAKPFWRPDMDASLAESWLPR